MYFVPIYVIMYFKNYTEVTKMLEKSFKIKHDIKNCQQAVKGKYKLYLSRVLWLSGSRLSFTHISI
jgi:hypothetical protein